MQSRSLDHLFGVGFDFATDNLMNQESREEIATFPPTPGNFELLDGTPFLLLDGTNFLLL